MEKGLEKACDEIISGNKVVGCMFGNRQGLCFAAKGIASSNSTGLAVAISEQACKLEPNSNPPIVSLESQNKSCFIQKYGNITGVIYRQT